MGSDGQWFKYVDFFLKEEVLSQPQGSEKYCFAYTIHMYFLKCIINLFHSVEMLKVSNYPFQLQNNTKGNTIILNLSLFKV